MMNVLRCCDKHGCIETLESHRGLMARDCDVRVSWYKLLADGESWSETIGLWLDPDEILNQSTWNTFPFGNSQRWKRVKRNKVGDDIACLVLDT